MALMTEQVYKDNRLDMRSSQSSSPQHSPQHSPVIHATLIPITDIYGVPSLGQALCKELVRK